MKRRISQVDNVEVITLSDDDDPPKTVTIKSARSGKYKRLFLGPDDSLQLSELQRRFRRPVKLLLTKDNKERYREPYDGIFAAPKKGWDRYEVVAVDVEHEIPRTTDICSRFNVELFDELWALHQFAARGIDDMKSFVEYRGDAIEVFLPVILNLGPDGFDMSTLYRISVGYEPICGAMMQFVQKHRQCDICDVKFKTATEAMMHFASIDHGQNCMATSQEPELLETLLLISRDLGFFEEKFITPKIDVVELSDADVAEAEPNDFKDVRIDSPPPATSPPTPPSPVASTPRRRQLSNAASSVSGSPRSERDSDQSSNSADSTPLRKLKEQLSQSTDPPPTIFEYFGVKSFDQLVKLPTFQSPVKLACNAKNSFNNLRRFCVTHLEQFFTTVKDRDVPIMYYLYLAHERDTMLCDIQKKFSKRCKCKANLTMTHVFDMEHIERYPISVVKELWAIVDHVAKLDKVTSNERATLESTLFRAFDVDSKEELFSLKQFSVNLCVTEAIFKPFRERIFDIIIKLKDPKLAWLSSTSFSLDKLLFIRGRLQNSSGTKLLYQKLNHGRFQCSECGATLDAVDYYKHVIKNYHLDDAAFEKLAAVMEQLHAGSTGYTTFEFPRTLPTATIKKRLTYLNESRNQNPQHSDEVKLLNSELKKRTLDRRDLH